jgi:DNA-damage-inducible protein J
MKTAIIHARIEPQIKRKAEGVLHNLGISPTEAIRIFYRQITLRQGLPFAVSVPNKSTVATLEKSRRGEDVQKFDSLDDMFESWMK